MKRLVATLAFPLFLAGAANAHEATKAGFGSLSPDAPPETAQFDFMVGDWSCEIRSMSPDGKMGQPTKANWTAYYILDGWAIQDEWTSPGPNGKPSYGTNIRSFNPQTGKWDNRWLASGSLQWKYFEAEKVGDTMVMTGEGVGPQQSTFLDRNTFHEIGDTSWKWRKDRSFDGGKNWIEGIAVIDCSSSTDSQGP